MILKNWRSQNPLWVNSCLLSHKEKPELTRLACTGLLKNWEALVIRQKKRFPLFTWHIFNALAHPFLRELAREKAEEMLAKGREFCGGLLFDAAGKIVGEGVFPGRLGGPEED